MNPDCSSAETRRVHKKIMCAKSASLLWTQAAFQLRQEEFIRQSCVPSQHLFREHRLLSAQTRRVRKKNMRAKSASFPWIQAAFQLSQEEFIRKSCVPSQHLFREHRLLFSWDKKRSARRQRRLVRLLKKPRSAYCRCGGIKETLEVLPVRGK